MKFFSFKINPIFLVFLSGGVAAYFLLAALLSFWNYLKLTERAPALVHEWKILPLSSSAYAIEASYRFEAQGRSFSGQTILPKPYHLNSFSAEQQIKNFSSQKWEVWYEAESPLHSSLQRIFPTKKVIYAVMTLGFFLYFFWVYSQFLGRVSQRDDS